MDNKELAYLICTASSIYKEPSISFPAPEELDLQKLLRLAIENKLGYHITTILLSGHGTRFYGKIGQTIRKFTKSSIQRLETLGEALSLLVSSLPGCIIFKTYKHLMGIPHDIDVLVEDLRQALQNLVLAGMKIYDSHEHSATLTYKGCVRVHLQDRVTWAGTTFLDQELIYSNSRFVTLWNVRVKIPSNEANFLIDVAHINFENLHITLQDFLNLCKEAASLKWEVVLEQASKYHWDKTLYLTLRFIDGLHHALYADVCPFARLPLKHEPVHKERLVFPQAIPKHIMFMAFFEKRPLTYLAGRITKVLSLVLLRNSYKRFFRPPEEELI